MANDTKETRSCITNNAGSTVSAAIFSVNSYIFLLLKCLAPWWNLFTARKQRKGRKSTNIWWCVVSSYNIPAVGVRGRKKSNGKIPTHHLPSVVSVCLKSIRRLREFLSAPENEADAGGGLFLICPEWVCVCHAETRVICLLTPLTTSHRQDLLSHARPFVTKSVKLPLGGHTFQLLVL